MGLDDKLVTVKRCYNYGRMGVDAGLALTAMTAGIIAVQLGAKDESYVVKGCEAVMLYALADMVDRYKDNDRLYLANKG